MDVQKIWQDEDLAENPDKNVAEISEKLMEIFGEKVLMVENRKSAKRSFDLEGASDPEFVK